MRDYTEEELKMLSDVLPNIALQLRTSLSTIYTAVDRMAPQETREKDPKTDRTARKLRLPAVNATGRRTFIRRRYAGLY